MCGDFFRGCACAVGSCGGVGAGEILRRFGRWLPRLIEWCLSRAGIRGSPWIRREPRPGGLEADSNERRLGTSLHQGHSGARMPVLRDNGEGWGTRNTQDQTHPPSPQDGFGGLRLDENRSAPRTDLDRRLPELGEQITDHAVADLKSGISNFKFRAPRQSPFREGSGQANHGTQAADHGTRHFDAAAYASFERSTNDVVARDVRGSISDTLARVLPEGVNDGAAKRIGEDIFNEVHRALAADRALSEQIGDVLRDRRFGSVEQQRVASLLAGRAKQIVPSVARRVIGEWTSSVLGTARTKAARQAAAASRVDIAAPGGSLDSMPLRALTSREVNYASMSDDEILNS